MTRKTKYMLLDDKMLALRVQHQKDIDILNANMQKLRDRMGEVETKVSRETAIPLVFADNEDSKAIYRECVERKLDKIFSGTSEWQLRRLMTEMMEDVARARTAYSDHGYAVELGKVMRAVAEIEASIERARLWNRIKRLFGVRND